MNTIVFDPIRTDFITKALKTFWKYSTGDWNVVVVDQTVEGIPQEAKDMTSLLIRPRFNLGFAKSMNEGMIHGLRWKSDYIVASNDDVEFIDKRWWDGIMEVFQEIPNALVVNPASIADRNEKPRIPYKDEYTPEDYDGLVKNSNGFVLDGICMWMPVFPRKTLETVGPFDERFYPGGGEDYDYNGRVYKAGGRCLGSLKGSWVVHYWGKSKDESGVVQKALPMYKPVWNHLDQLWPSGFDLFASKEGKPLPRVPDIHVDPLIA